MANFVSEEFYLTQFCRYKVMVPASAQFWGGLHGTWQVSGSHPELGAGEIVCLGPVPVCAMPQLTQGPPVRLHCLPKVPPWGPGPSGGHRSCIDGSTASVQQWIVIPLK